MALVISSILFLVFYGGEIETHYNIKLVSYLISMFTEFIVWFYGLAIFLHMIYIMWKRHRIEFKRTAKSLAILAIIILLSFFVFVMKTSRNLLDYSKDIGCHH